MGLSRCSLTLEQKSPVVKNKLDSVMARLDRLYSEDEDDDALCDKSQHERREKLLGWDDRIGSKSQSH